jgi:hypothetical protein
MDEEQGGIETATAARRSVEVLVAEHTYKGRGRPSAAPPAWTTTGEAASSTSSHAGRGRARRMAAAIPQRDLCARLGGDEFALFVHASPTGAPFELLGRIQKALASPMELKGLPVSIQASLGAARFPKTANLLGS